MGQVGVVGCGVVDTEKKSRDCVGGFQAARHRLSHVRCQPGAALAPLPGQWAVLGSLGLQALDGHSHGGEISRRQDRHPCGQR